MSSFESSARRYRPKKFADVVGQDAIVTTLQNAVKMDRLSHAYLFSGSRGTGKTTLARLLAKVVNCENRSDEIEPCGSCSSCKEIGSSTSLDVLEIDGASHRGIDDMRELTESVGYAAAGGRCKIYIIDEVHMLTKEAFNALLKTLEEPPPNVKFFLATTEPNKLPATIVSRCQRFALNRIGPLLIEQKLRKEASELGATINDEALQLISRAAEGGMRDAESLFDQVLSFHGTKIDGKAARDVLGLMPVETFSALDKATQEGKLEAAFEIANEVFASGKSLPYFIEGLIEHYRSHLLDALNGKGVWSREQCLTLLDLLVEAQVKIKEAPSERLALEMLLLRIVRNPQRLPIETLVERLEALQTKTVATPPTKKEAPPPPPKKKPQVQHDTVLRFAAVELEGIVKKT